MSLFKAVFILFTLFSTLTSFGQTKCFNSTNYQSGYTGGWNDSKELIKQIFELEPLTGVRCGSTTSPTLNADAISDISDGGSSSTNCNYSLSNAIIDVFNNQEVKYRLHILSNLAINGDCYASGAHDGLVNGLMESLHYPKKI
jgi:hypothetical protein